VVRWRHKPYKSGNSALCCHVGSHHETATSNVAAKGAVKLLLGMVVMR
jgi:hypothetical protein